LLNKAGRYGNSQKVVRGHKNGQKLSRFVTPVEHWKRIRDPLPYAAAATGPLTSIRREDDTPKTPKSATLDVR